MRKPTIILCLLTAILWLAVGAVRAKDTPIQQRGWIGGTYECAKSSQPISQIFLRAKHTFSALPAELKKSKSAGMLIESLGTNTPAYLAGLREGDLILETDGHPITGWRGFWQTVDASQPGSMMQVKAYRAGQTVDCRVTVGCEKYRKAGSVAVYIPVHLDSLHLIPTRENPRFSLMLLGYEQKDDRPAEFDSVKEQYVHACYPQEKQTASSTDWRLWLVVVALTRDREILSQDVVPPGQKKHA